MTTPGTLAHRVDYRRLALQERGVEGRIAVAALPRVAAEMARPPEPDDEVVVELGFDEDGQRRVHAAGTIRTTLALRCQRCLQVYDEPMDVAVCGIVVGDDEAAANVPRADEPILADGDMLDVHALVSDELLLALPSVARCRRPECMARYAPEPASERAEQRARRQDNPFAVLSQLKRDE